MPEIKWCGTLKRKYLQVEGQFNLYKFIKRFSLAQLTPRKYIKFYAKHTSLVETMFIL